MSLANCMALNTQNIFVLYSWITLNLYAVKHDLLLAKLKVSEFLLNPVTRIRGDLKNRKKKVLFSGKLSDEKTYYF